MNWSMPLNAQESIMRLTSLRPATEPTAIPHFRLVMMSVMPLLDMAALLRTATSAPISIRFVNCISCWLHTLWESKGSFR